MIKHKNAAADRPYPLLWDGHDYAPLPLESLTIDTCDSPGCGSPARASNR